MKRKDGKKLGANDHQSAIKFTTNSPIGQHRRSWRYHGSGAAFDGDSRGEKIFSCRSQKKTGDIGQARNGETGTLTTKTWGITEAVPQGMRLSGFQTDARRVSNRTGKRSTRRRRRGRRKRGGRWRLALRLLLPGMQQTTSD